MQPEFSDHYEIPPENISLRVDYFKEGDPVTWLILDNFSLPLKYNQVWALQELVKDLTDDWQEQ